MVNGIDIFSKHFQDFQDQYTVIGGLACDLLMSEAGFDFRLTQDIDIVLIVEALTDRFGHAFWKFIEDGGYRARQKSNGKPEFYRFIDPTTPGYPKMIELFSRPQQNVKLNFPSHLIPLHIDDEISSLSAILLNDAYYQFLLQGRRIADNVSILDALHIIPLKMKAWLDLGEKKQQGQHVNSRDLRKHPLDVFRLFQLISPDARVSVPAEVYADIQQFIDLIHNVPVGLDAIGIRREKESMLEIFSTVYVSE